MLANPLGLSGTTELGARRPLKNEIAESRQAGGRARENCGLSAQSGASFRREQGAVFHTFRLSRGGLGTTGTGVARTRAET